MKNCVRSVQDQVTLVHIMAIIPHLFILDFEVSVNSSVSIVSVIILASKTACLWHFKNGQDKWKKRSALQKLETLQVGFLTAPGNTSKTDCVLLDYLPFCQSRMSRQSQLCRNGISSPCVFSRLFYCYFKGINLLRNRELTFHSLNWTIFDVLGPGFDLWVPPWFYFGGSYITSQVDWTAWLVLCGLEMETCVEKK